MRTEPYPPDLTEAQWALIAPMVEPRPGGRPATHSRRRIVDAQSVEGADTVGADSRGYDAGKKTNGCKRHIVVDTLGLLIIVPVIAASLQDRDGGAGSLTARRWRCR